MQTFYPYAYIQFYRRGSDVTNEQAPTKTRVRVDEDGNVTSENLTWAQAQRLVEVEDDASNRIYRLSIFEVIIVVAFDRNLTMNGQLQPVTQKQSIYIKKFYRTSKSTRLNKGNQDHLHQGYQFQNQISKKYPN